MKKDIVKELHPLEKKVLLAFKQKEILTLAESIKLTQLSSAQFRSAIEPLLDKQILAIPPDVKLLHTVSLTELGKEYAENGTLETQIVSILKQKGKIHIKELNIPDAGSAIGFLKKENIIEVKKGILELKSDATKVETIQTLINKVSKGDVIKENLSPEEQKFVALLYRKRGEEKGVFRIIQERINVEYQITDYGKRILDSLETREEISQLSPELLKDESWRGKEFREYNIEKLIPKKVVIGNFHPYMEFLSNVRERLTQLGFCEVTGEIVETEFWNLDALFMPQFHSAREIHGIYFVKSPKYGADIEQGILEQVARTHENGGATGSKGWRYKFDKEQAKRLILRSHGTVLSVRTLALHPEPPGKYFAIARCFRPDAVDSTHAPDFFQIEGIVVSENINFRSLLGLLKLFATEIARAKEIKFTPGYFPFTEPSVELHAKHPELGWVELGGAGIFRQEVTLPLGVKVPVIAWGLGLDRMAMMSIGIQDIRDLFSRDLEFLRKK